MERYGNENPGAFQSTRPLRGVTSQPITKVELLGEFQPTRPLRGATTKIYIKRREAGISTHAPLAGRDPVAQPVGVVGKISTHAPLAGRDGWPRSAGRTIYFISTHAPLAGRDICKAFREQNYAGISTHAPLAGRDSKSVQITMHIFAITDKFQMLLHRMPPVRAFCSFLMQENHADFGCEPPK